MTSIKRRTLLKTTGVLAGAGLTLPLTFAPSSAQTNGKVVLIGGGFGGATCANYLKRWGPRLDVTLIEKDQQYYTCPFSNAVIAGDIDMAAITHGYNGLQQSGVNLVHDEVTAVDTSAKKVTLKDNSTLDYDMLVVSPGIDFVWGKIENDQQATQGAMPHAYKAGAQTELLRRQIQAMPDGGTVLIVPPLRPFRCPPGPYERASLIANYLKHNKPKSKILIVDANETHSKKAAFHQGWERLYPGMIEWIKSTEGGNVVAVDPNAMTVEAEFGEVYQGDVINLIPYQQAGRIAELAGLTNDSGWCPVHQDTFESQLAADVYVIGDACIAGAMPKSGHSAASQAKNCAAVIVSRLAGKSLLTPTYANTCYSLLSPQYAISVAAVYRFQEDEIKRVAGGVTELDLSDEVHAAEARYANAWYRSITSDMFA